MSALSGGLGGAASLAGESVADQIVGAYNLDKWASVGTEVGVSAGFGAVANATVQGIGLAAGWQNRFSVGSLGISTASAAGMAGLRIASEGYLRSSTAAAKEYFADKPGALARYSSRLGDPTVNRISGYREGGYLHSSLNPGNTVPGQYSSNYERTFGTFVHETSHYYELTADEGMYNNAYSFESWVTQMDIYDPVNDFTWTVNNNRQFTKW
jgi:hypothetical protein